MKSKAYQEFKSALDLRCGLFTPEKATILRRKLVSDALAPLGKELYSNEEEWTNLPTFNHSDKLDDKKKDQYYEQWKNAIEIGVFDPEPTAGKKSVPKKRGGGKLSNLSLDDLDTEPKKEEKEVKVIEKEWVDSEKIDGLLPKEEEEKDCPDELPIKSKQSEWEELPVEERAARTIAKQQNKTKDEPVSKSKKEQALELLLGGDDSLSEQEVIKIANNVFADLLSEVIGEIRDGGGLNAVANLLAQIKKDNG